MRWTRLSSALAARPLRQRRSRPALVRLGIRAAVAVVVVLVVALVGATVFVLAGPTEFGFVRDRIAGTIDASLGPGYSVGIARAVVDVDPVLGLVVRVDDIDVRDDRQAVVAHVPSTRFAVDPWSLLRLRVDIREVELSGADISFVSTPGGAVRLGDADTALPAPSSVVAGGFPDLFAALSILDRGIEPPIDTAVAAGFERFSLVNGNISVWDAARRQQRRFPGTDLSVVVDRGTKALAVNFSTSGYGGKWTATIDRDVEARTRGHALSVVFSQLTVADVVPSLAEAGNPVLADIPLYGRASVQFDKDGSLQEASARLDLGAGAIRFGHKPDTLILDEATIRLRWDPANSTLVVEPSTFFFGQTRGVVTGRITAEGDPAERRYRFVLESPGAILAPGDSGEPPMIAQRLGMSGVADLNKRLLTVDNAVLAGQDASIAMAGSVGFDGETPSLVMAASFSPMTVGQLKQMWVPFIAPEARDWVMDHMFAGRIVSGRFEAAVPAGMMWTGKPIRLPDDAMKLDMRIEDAGFKTFGELPPITNAGGNIVMAGSTFGIDFDHGEVVVPSGTVQLEAGAFAISNLAQRPPDGVIELELSGSATALAEIADAEPLQALSRNNVAPGDLSGTGTASISVRMPMRDGLTEADVDWRVTINGKGVSSRVPIQGRLFSDADVSMTVKPDGVSVYGKARIDGVVADLSMALPLTLGHTQRPGERQIRLVLDDDARKRLGIALDQIISGTIGALVTDNATGGQHYDLDMQRARLTLNGVGWSKGIGVPATLAFDLNPVDDGYAVTNLVLKGDGFGLSGTAKLDKSYALVSADVDHLSLRKGDQVAVKVTRGSSGGYGISARGTSFDLRGMISNLRDRYEQSGGFPDLALDARVDKLIGFNQEVIANAALSLVSVGGETQKVSFAGALGDSSISLDYAVSADGIKLNGSATDLGRLLRFTDFYARAEGGTVTLTGEAAGQGPMLGTLDFADFDVLNEPAIAQAIGEGRAAAGGADRVHFDRLVAQFRQVEKVLAIEDAVLRGPQLGAAFAGRYDAAAATITVTGTYIPLYPINNFFGRIPVLGLVMGAGPREGLIGVTFKVDGPIAEPHVFINPLSAVAPGIFRKIFDFQ
jgi:hypothetical protein